MNSDTPSKPSSIKPMKLSGIKQNPTNPRIIKDDKFQKLVTSIKEFPEMLEARPIVVNPDMIVLGGNMRLKAAKAAGLTEAPVYVATWEESKAKEFIVKDNVGFGEWDWDILANEWDAAELDEWGLDVWQPEEEEKEGLTEADEVPEAPEEPKTKLGDLYILGDHRLLCGDSTKAEDVEKLMNGEQADLCLTDPPYGLGDTTSVKNNYDTYQDTKENLSSLIHLFLPLAQENSNITVITPGNGNAYKYPTPTWTMAWFTPAGVGRGPWGFCCWQPILCYGKDPKLAKRKGAHPDAIVHTESAEKFGHPCSKPINFWTWLMERTSEKSQLIYDPFSGSGTTHIAAEKTNRKCYGMELDPKYCDVIVKRWEDFTGKKAELWKP